MKEKYPKLPKKFKAKWVAALRSGRYKKGMGALLNDRLEYCCLGVACKVAGVKPPNGKAFIPLRSTSKNFKNIPKILINRKEPLSIPLILANKNDTHWYTFNRIADWIDKNL